MYIILYLISYIYLNYKLQFLFYIIYVLIPTGSEHKLNRNKLNTLIKKIDNFIYTYPKKN